MQYIDISAFREREAQGLITARPHPTYDLIIWNYTPLCQYEHMWDDITLQARGLVTTSDGIVVARAFTKFFNLEEHQGPIPLEPFKVTEKLDGSLLIVARYQDNLIVATRGSFISEQSDRAREIVQQRYRNFAFLPHYTYLFEVIYPENRIVVDYGAMEDIVLLAVITTATGKEIDIHHPETVVGIDRWPFPVVKHYDGITDIDALRTLEEANKEGFVIHFASGLRLKVKFSEYVRLHRLMTKVNARVIWNLLKNQQPIDGLLDRVPDEFYTWVKHTVDDFHRQFRRIEEQCRRVVAQVKDLPTRKEQAAVIVRTCYPGIVFSMLDQKNYQDAIWKLLYPEASRPFKIDEDA
jgi:RNA ligase